MPSSARDGKNARLGDGLELVARKISAPASPAMMMNATAQSCH
jgi:hypothetical protein